MRPVCLWGFSKLVMGSPKPSGIIKPSVPSKLVKNVDGKWPQANGKNMRGNRLIVPSCENSIKGQRRVLHRPNGHHALWSTTKTTPKTTWGYSPVPYSSTRRRWQGHCGWGGEWCCGVWRQKSHPSSDTQEKSGQDQCRANGGQSTTGPADVCYSAGLGRF